MFIRWKHRTKKPKPFRSEPEVRRSAVLVESVRVDGQPRLRHIAVLGGVHGDGSGDVGFWRSVYAALERLRAEKRITAKDRKRIIAELAEQVPLVTPAGIARWDRAIRRRVAATFS
jgi:hypothetical protein